MNDEIPSWVGWLVGILAIALFAAFLWLGSWERVFLLIGAVFVAFLAAAVLAVTSAFTFTKARAQAHQFNHSGRREKSVRGIEDEGPVDWAPKEDPHCSLAHAWFCSRRRNDGGCAESFSVD